MWECKHCKKQFDLERACDKANHSKWCDSNPKKKTFLENHKKSMGVVHDKKSGVKKDFEVTCSTCGDHFVVTERVKLFPSKEKYYCSISCSNSIGGKAKNDMYGFTSYRSICFKHHDKKCVVCGEELIVAVHHLDGDHTNNDPNNLIPLCPTHHHYWHSKYRHLIEDQVNMYIKEFMGL